MKTERIKWIDSLKGFAIILVVIGHVADGYLDSHMFAEYEGFMFTVRNLIYAFHMPLFFLVSGVLFYLSYYKDGTCDKKRCNTQIFNIVAIYFLFSIILWIFKFLLADNVNIGVSIWNLILMPILPMAPYWYLYVLVFLYIIARILLKNSFSPPVMFILFTIVGAIGFWAFGKMVFPLYQILYYAVFFLIGVYMVKFKDCFLNKKLFCLISFFVSLALLIFFWNSGKYFNEIYAANIIIAIGLCSLFVFIFKEFEILCKSKTLQICGKYCLEIYVLHCFLTAGNRVFLPKVGINEFWVSFILNSVISTALPVLFAFICKKIKVHGILFQPVKYLKSKYKTKKEQP